MVKLLRHRDYVQDMPLEESLSIQLGPGAPEFETMTAFGRDCLIGTMNVGPLLSVSILAEKGWVAFLIPISWSGDFVFNGQIAKPFDVFYSCRRSGYTTLGQQRRNIHIGFRERTFLQALAALRGVDSDDVRLDDFALSLSDQEGRVVHNLALQTLNSAEHLPMGASTFALPDDRERDFISAFASLISARVLGDNPRYSPRFSPLEVVRRAELSWGLSTTTTSVTEMCEVSGISERWLRKSFYDVYGISPIQYIKSRRLSLARDKILDRHSNPHSVKEVALELGFTGSGRFAREYRELFGEFPSETLERNS